MKQELPGKIQPLAARVRKAIPAFAGMTLDREGNRRSVGVSVSVVSEAD